MGPISILFGNPAVKILENRLWESARKRYLQEHPSDRNNDAGTIRRKARTAYKDEVAACVKQATPKVKARWGQFKDGMVPELTSNLSTLFRMSEVDWYALEAGSTISPAVIAVPYNLLKHMTGALLFQSLRKGIEFEDLDDETLKALSTCATEQRFEDVLERSRRHYEAFEIGSTREAFVVAEIVRRDAYFVGDEKHHSLIDMVILTRAGSSLSDATRKARKDAVRKWSEQDRKNRRNERRFSGDGWEMGFEELQSLLTDPHAFAA